MPDFANSDDIRAAFSEKLSAMYRDEVPLYGALLDIVRDVNARVAADRGQDEPVEPRLGSERHGAIRLGTAEELRLTRRMFAVMGMHPVGYYDLAPAGVPVHSTAFRPVEPKALARSPFRVFTSLLRLDLVDDPELRSIAERSLSSRHIYNEAAIALLEIFERNGGLSASDAERFVDAATETFRWRAEAIVDAETYRRLNASHRLVADIVAFLGPHVNHLTPRTLDIDEAQTEMIRRGIDAKTLIEGPPPRRADILLRQTSFKALEEAIWFPGERGREAGAHTARFGEIEQRGMALTPLGRSLYDELLASGPDGLERFPDDVEQLRRERLAYFSYRLAASVGDKVAHLQDAEFKLDDLLRAGHIEAEPILYEDFLPVSAAGIFRSNLGDAHAADAFDGGSQAEFERALGAPVTDPHSLYAEQERRSLAALERKFGRLPEMAD